MHAEYGQQYTARQRDRSRFRKWVRRLYLRHARAQLRGPTLDFGCGIGELLERLPAGSLGVEFNQASVEHCVQRGLPAMWYDGVADNWRLSSVDGRFDSMVLSHVLEHFDDPGVVLSGLLAACALRSVERVLVIVPGSAGYRNDPTHRCFVDQPMLRGLVAHCAGWTVEDAHYFPFNARNAGDWFVYNELHVLLVRAKTPMLEVDAA